MTCSRNTRKGNEDREKLEKKSRETYLGPKRSCITCGSFETIIVSVCCAQVLRLMSDFFANPRTVAPCGSDSKESASNAGDPGSIPGLGRSPREGNGNPLQYSCLENSMDRGAWWTTVHGVTESLTRLSDLTFTLMDCSPQGSSVHGILQARIVEWVAISSSRSSSPTGDGTRVSTGKGLTRATESNTLEGH